MSDLKVCLIGLDTSHTISFAKSFAAPDCPPAMKIEGVKVTSCLRFSTPFQSEEGLNERQTQLEAWGIPVTLDFDEAVKDCDAIMLEINDPAYHLEYFKKCVGLVKPIFLDKPVADNIQNAKEIIKLIKENDLKVMSSSSLRFMPELNKACDDIKAPTTALTYGPLGKAPAGSSVVWYGVHAFEMLQRIMGLGAKTVQSIKDARGVVNMIEYADGRRGIVELTEKAYQYGGYVREGQNTSAFTIDMSIAYVYILREIVKFFQSGEPTPTMENTIEVMAMIDAAEQSVQTGNKIEINLD